MKPSLVLFLLFALSQLTAQGQEYTTNDTRDYRAILNIHGRINEISVAPDERIWLTTTAGETYFTNSIDSNWHYGKPLSSWHYGQPVPPPRYNWSDIPWEKLPHLNRISFFNADTAIMTGSISSHSDKDWIKSGYYRTTDGGLAWELRDYGGDGWIYAAITSNYGHAWLGTADKTIYYSTDFGEHFKALKIPLKKSDMIYGLYMADSFRGIIGSDENEILITENNWRTARSIPTPLDQKKLVYSKRSPRPEVSKVLIWGPYLIVKQRWKVFYALSTNKIDWQPFPVQIYDFALDKNTNLLWAVDNSHRVLTFTSPTEYVLATNEHIPAYPIDIKAVNSSLYMILSDNRICRANHNGLTCHLPYTTDHAIEQPKLVKSGKTMIWGTMNKQLYIADKRSQQWFREAELDFKTEDIRLLSDSVAILWDGSQNHLYSLRTHTMEDYTQTEPLTSFLSYPIKKLIIKSGSSGCFHRNEYRIEYNANQDSLFTSALISYSGNLDDRMDSAFECRINHVQLSRLLENINTNLENTPDIQDFNITEADITRYYAELNRQRMILPNRHIKKKTSNRWSVYHSVPAMLDLIDKTTLSEILNMDNRITSTTRHWFEVEYINQNNDTCRTRNFYYENGDSWFLPWRFEFKGQHFNCYDIALSRFIKDCITEDFYGHEAFDNAVLLMKIGDYFYYRKH